MADMVTDFGECSGDEIVQLQKANQARSTQLRHEMRALLDSRLARKITKEEFDLQRALINEGVLACRQRGMALDDARLSRAYSDRGLRQRLSATV
jgi:hypothetical protein